jgi:hypothetical protein
MPNADDNPFRDILSEEEFQAALRAEQEILNRQRQIEGK